MREGVPSSALALGALTRAAASPLVAPEVDALLLASVASEVAVSVQLLLAERLSAQER